MIDSPTQNGMREKMFGRYPSADRVGCMRDRNLDGSANLGELEEPGRMSLAAPLRVRFTHHPPRRLLRTGLKTYCRKKKLFLKIFPS